MSVTCVIVLSTHVRTHAACCMFCIVKIHSDTWLCAWPCQIRQKNMQPGMAVRMAMPNQTEKHATRHGCAHGHAKTDRKICNQAWPCVPWSKKKKKNFEFFPHKAVIVHMLFHFPKSFHFPIPFLFPIPRVCKFLTNFFIFQLLEYLNTLSFTNSFLYLITHLIPLSSFITQFHLFQFLSFFLS